MTANNGELYKADSDNANDAIANYYIMVEKNKI